MKHPVFFAALAALVLILTPLAASAQTPVRNPDVARAEAYLKELKTAKADFIQNSSLGSRLSGTFYLNRPGKMRFDYNEIEDFIVADGFFVYYYDSELGEQSNAPIGQTLADFLLREDLSLTEDLIVTTTYRKDGQLFLTVIQKDNPAAGQVELVFHEIPFALARWIVTDAQGQTTEVKLKNLETGMAFKDVSLFGYTDPKGRKRFND